MDSLFRPVKRLPSDVNFLYTSYDAIGDIVRVYKSPRSDTIYLCMKPDRIVSISAVNLAKLSQKFKDFYEQISDQNI